MTPQYSTQDVKQVVAQHSCWSDCCYALKISVCTFNFKKLQRICNEEGFSTAHFASHKNRGGFGAKHTIESALVENSSVPRGTLNKLLRRLGLYTGTCKECGTGDEWNGKPLTLEVDHINGNHSDNRRENLRWLCPNCHSQTSNYRRRGGTP